MVLVYGLAYPSVASFRLYRCRLFPDKVLSGTRHGVLLLLCFILFHFFWFVP